MSTRHSDTPSPTASLDDMTQPKVTSALAKELEEAYRRNVWPDAGSFTKALEPLLAVFDANVKSLETFDNTYRPAPEGVASSAHSTYGRAKPKLLKSIAAHAAGALDEISAGFAKKCGLHGKDRAKLRIDALLALSTAYDALGSSLANPDVKSLCRGVAARLKAGGYALTDGMGICFMPQTAHSDKYWSSIAANLKDGIDLAAVAASAVCERSRISGAPGMQQ